MTFTSNIVDQKYPLYAISNEAHYLKSCEILEEMDAFVLEETEDREEKLAYLDALAKLIEEYEDKHFKFNKIKLTPQQILEQTLEQLRLE